MVISNPLPKKINLTPDEYFDQQGHISISGCATWYEVLHYSIWSVVVFAILSHCFCNTYPEFARSINIFYNFCKNHFFKNESHQRYAKKCCANFFLSADGTPKHGLKGNGRGHSFHKNYINLSKKFIILDFRFVYPNLVGGGGVKSTHSLVFAQLLKKSRLEPTIKHPPKVLFFCHIFTWKSLFFWKLHFYGKILFYVITLGLHQPTTN